MIKMTNNRFIQSMIAGFGRSIDYNTVNWIFLLNFKDSKSQELKEPGLNGTQFRSSSWITAIPPPWASGGRALGSALSLSDNESVWFLRGDNIVKYERCIRSGSTVKKANNWSRDRLKRKRFTAHSNQITESGCTNMDNMRVFLFMPYIQVHKV